MFKRTLLSFILALSFIPCLAQTNYIGNYEGAKVVEEKTYDFIEFPMFLKLKYLPHNKISRHLEPETKVGHFNARTLLISKNIDQVRVYYNYQEKLKELGYEIIIAASSTTADEQKIAWFNSRASNFISNLETIAHMKVLPSRSSSSQYNPTFFIAAKKITKEEETYVNFFMSNNNKKDARENLMAIAVLEKALITKDKIDTFKPEFLTAADIKRSLDKDGKASLYNIYFDFDKASIKAESEPAIKEIVKYLQQNPNEKLIVTGHTDNVGEFGYNIELSQKRSFAVLGKLIKGYGIDARRLLGFGAGMTAPLASNDTENGKAQNRRVELVKWSYAVKPSQLKTTPAPQASPSP